MSDQISQLSTTEQQPLMKRLFNHRWFRVVGFLVLAGLIAAITYVVFGLVPGGSATLRMFPASGTYQSGQGFVVGITLESPSAPVVAVTAVIKYNTAKITPVLSGIQVGSDWSTSAKIVEKVTSDITGDLDYNQQLKITIGQPSPGIQGSVPLSIVDIPFRVVASSDAAFAGTTMVAIDGAKSLVIKDDSSGSDILGTVSPPVQYSVFPSLSTQSCSATHPGGMVCAPVGLVYCPTEFRYPTPPGGWIEGADCCQANRCATIPTLKIVDGSPNVDVAPFGTGGKYQAIFTWSTNVGVATNGVEGGLTAQAQSDGSSTRHLLVIPNLAANQTYTVRVWSRQTFNGTTQTARSVDLTFTTGNQNVVNKLLIYDLVADSITNTSARISWTTNFPANGSVSCSPTCSVTMNTSSFSTRHDARLLNLTKGTTYMVAVKSVMRPRNVNDPSTNPEIENANREASGSATFETTNLAIQNDANLILKVDRDRQCGKWMTCVSSVTVQNKQKKDEEMCVARGVCDTLDPETGTCLNVLGSAPGSSFSSNYNSPEGSTVDLAANLSGLSRASNVWRGYAPVGFGDYDAAGVEPVSTLQEFGSSVSVPNGTFQNGAVFPWKPQPQGSSQIRLESDYDIGSVVLVVTPQNPTSTTESFGAKVSIGSDALSVGKPYYVSFQTRADVDPRALDRGTKIRVQFLYRGETNPTSNVLNSAYELEVGPGWQQAILGPFIPPNLPATTGYPEGKLGDVSLAIIAPVGLSAYQPRSVAIDNVTISPVLRAGPGSYFPRICRAYASNSSPACDYFDPFSGRMFRGWKGYCLLPDSRDTTECLQWWPIDVVGSSPFAVETPAGYLADGGRLPLYYCLEAEGNAPYRKSETIHTVQGNLSCGRGSNTDMYPYARGGGCSGFYTFPREPLPPPPYPISEIAGIKISWYFARDDNSCTLRDYEQVVWLNSENDFKNVGYINHDDAGSHVTSFVVERLENGRFSVSACSSTGMAAGTVWRIVATYHMRESCNVIAQVVTPDGQNKAQTDRVKQPLNFEACVRNPFADECKNNYTVPGLGFWYGSDFAPFGAALHPDPDLNPEEWASKLFIEPSFDSYGVGQARAGQPYSVRPPFVGSPTCALTGAVCDLSDPTTCPAQQAQCRPVGVCCSDDPNDTNPPNCSGSECFEQSDCTSIPGDPYNYCGGDLGGRCSNDITTTCTVGDVTSCPGNQTDQCLPPASRQAIGPRLCISGSEIGKECRVNEDCGEDDGGNLGLCTGPEKPPSVGTWDNFSRSLLSNPKTNLSNLFVETYGTWQWFESKYIKICEAGGDRPVCVGGTNAGEVCGVGGVVCASGRCGYQYRQLDGVYVSTGQCGDSTTGIVKQFGWSPSSVGVPKGVPPKVRNIRVNDLPEVTKVCPTETSCYFASPNPNVLLLRMSTDLNDYPFEGIEQYPVKLTFNSNVNSNQLPLRRYTVDWGDGTVTSESDLQIRSKDDPKNPHTLGHWYQFKAGNPGCSTNKCEYQIRIQIEDNWGWCNENTANPECGLNVPGTPSAARAWAFFRKGSGEPQTITVWRSEQDFLNSSTVAR